MAAIPPSWYVLTAVSVVALIAVSVWALAHRKRQFLLLQRAETKAGGGLNELGGRSKAE
jgi:hypothetical protein